MAGMLGAVGAGALGGAAVTIVINAVDKFSKTFTKASFSIKSLGKIAAVGAIAAGVAIAGIGIAAVKTAADFETAFTGVRKTVSLNAKEFEELENRFKDLSTEIPMTFVELSQIGEIAGQLGVEGVDNLEKFTKTIAAISVTTNLSAEQAATDFARIANVMGVPISEIDRMGSSIVDLGNNFATSEAEIVAMTMRIMGAGKTVGLNTQEIFGMSASLSALGIRSEMGGSAISRAMITIAKSVATGSDELTKYAEVSGMSTDEFAVAWKEKPVEAMSAVIMGLKNISESGGNTFGVLEDLDLKSIRITDTMLRLAGSEGGITEAVNLSKTAWEENTALMKEAEERYKTFDSQVIKLTNSFKLLFAELGEVLIPVLIDLFKVIKDEIIPAIKPLIPLIGDFLSNAINASASMLPKLTGTLVKVMEIFVKLYDAIMPVLEPLFDIGFVLIDAIIDALTPFMPVISSVIKILEPFLKILTPIAEILGEIIGFIAELAGSYLGEVFGGLAKGAQQFGSFLGFEEGGIVPSTGLAMVHKGETIIPASASSQLLQSIELSPTGINRGVTYNYFTFENINGMSGRDIADSLQEELIKKI